MAPTRDKWVRRFIIPETARHKKGFTIYKVTSVVFLKSSHEEISKVSVWKRYNDFKKLHSELSVLYSRSQIKESFPKFPKSKYFGRFEAEVIEERRQSALKFLDFIGRHSFLYSSDIFIKFFETGHVDYCSTDCSQSLSSDTSEDDRNSYLNSAPSNDTISEPTHRLPKSIQDTKEHTDLTVAADNINKVDPISENVYEFKRSKNLESSSVRTNVNEYESDRTLVLETNITVDTESNTADSERFASELDNNQFMNNQNNNYDSAIENNIENEKRSSNVQTGEEARTENFVKESKPLIAVHDGSDLSQLWPDSSQYILIAAAHMSSASTHEANAEYEEAFTQYKMGISSLLTGVQSDTDAVRARAIKEKIPKYLERAEKLYHRHLNCNISLLNRPVSELQHYKIFKIMKSVMLVKDIRQNCLRIVKAVEKSSSNKESISNYILRGQVPYMVRLHAYVETETTVFLILQYLSRGKLWDFIMTQYKSQSDSVCDIKSTESVDDAFDSNSIALRENVKSKVEYEPIIKSDFVSTSPTVQTTYPVMIEGNHEIFTNDVSTTQLLEKAQILLQSVNATLEASNSVVSRLCESKQLKNLHDNTAFLNMKNSAYQSDTQGIITSDACELSKEIFNVNRVEIQQKENSPVANISEKCVANDNSSSGDDSRNDKSPYITDSSSLTNSCTDLSLSEKESSSYSLDTSKSVSSPVALEQTNSDKADMCNLELIKSFKASCTIRTDLSDSHMQNNNVWQNEVKGNSADFEEEVWKVPENTIRRWAAEILLALEALHQQEVIVFDLKPDNILLDDTGDVHVTYIVPHHNADLSKHKQPYASPELCLFLPTIPLTPATDIWSFGVILYELIVGNKFETFHPGLFHSHSIINIPNRLSKNAKSLLLNILKYEPNERMTIPEIKQHPFFDEIDWSSLVNSI